MWGAPGEVRLRAVGATAGVGVCALCCSGKMQLVCCQAKEKKEYTGSQQLLFAGPLANPFHFRVDPSIPSSLSSSGIQMKTETRAKKLRRGFKLMFD